jgi:histidine triad (HIT) family protein
VPPDIAASIVGLGQRFAVAMKRLYRVPRVAFAFTGGDIAHAHAHIVAMHEKTDITSRAYIVEETVTFREAPPAADHELAQTAKDLRQTLASLA